jgi:three-Cys-motif partner protein
MAGPGLCRLKETGEEFARSPLVALDHEFDRFIFIEEEPALAAALKQRIAKHPKAKRAKVIADSWLEVAKSGRLLFDDKTLVVAFIDPTGISQVPLEAMLELTKNHKVTSL